MLSQGRSLLERRKLNLKRNVILQLNRVIKIVSPRSLYLCGEITPPNLPLARGGAFIPLLTKEGAGEV